MMATGLILAPRNPNTGLLDPDYYPVPAGSEWRIASAYRLEHYQPMQLVHPLNSAAGTYAAFRWADSNMDHEVKISWVGDDAPYRVSIISAPAGSSIGGVQTQTFNRVAVEGTDLFEHQLPENFATYKRAKENFLQGESYTVTILVESQSESFVCIFDFTDDNTKSVWFSGTGSDAAAGTFATPKQTFGAGFNLSGGDQKIYRYKAGTYSVNNGTPLNNANFTGRCKSHIGYEPGVIFNYDTGHMVTGGDDLTFMNFKTIGGRPDVGNVRQFDFDSRTRRAIWHNIEFETNVIGLTAGDNPAAVFLGNVDSGNTGLVYHENISITDCTMTPGSKTQMYTIFSIENFSAFNSHALDMDTTAHNGSHAFHFKSQFRNCSMSFCSASGRTDTGLLWVSSQVPSLCSNISISHSLIDYAATNTDYNSTRLNGQVGGGQPNAVDLYLQRCSFIARQAGASGSSISADANGTNVPLAKISACAWQSAGSTFILGSGSENIGTASEKVVDVLSLANNKKGLIGHKIYSTLVT